MFTLPQLCPGAVTTKGHWEQQRVLTTASCWNGSRRRSGLMWHVWTWVPVGLFWKVVKSLGGRDSMEKVNHWGQRIWGFTALPYFLFYSVSCGCRAIASWFWHWAVSATSPNHRGLYPLKLWAKIKTILAASLVRIFYHRLDGLTMTGDTHGSVACS